MWDLIILTAGNENQRECFEKQLSIIDTYLYSKMVKVIPDGCSNWCRIGSGGATIQIIRYLFEFYCDDLQSKKILLCHSGGLSQRMPHQSAFGKVFGYLGNGKTLLEHKLEIYRDHLVDKLPFGLMVTASDVIEDMKLMKDLKNYNGDFLIFSHISTTQVGTQHGVFVIDEKSELKSVLQKPSMKEMEENNAIRKDGNVLTDRSSNEESHVEGEAGSQLDFYLELIYSCFQISWNICKELKSHKELGNISQELCCYGDFMRPMGYSPKLDYIDDKSEIGKYRRILVTIFSNINVKIINLGTNSFFHFGTFPEFFEHNSTKSNFFRCFQNNLERAIYLEGILPTNTESRYFIEFSRIVNVQNVPRNSFISGVDVKDIEGFPEDCVIFTLAIKQNRFVTIIFRIYDDMKEKKEKLYWNSNDTRIVNSSLWNARLFRSMGSRNESFKITLGEWLNGLDLNNKEERISIHEAIQMHDIDKEIEWRKSRMCRN